MSVIKKYLMIIINILKFNIKKPCLATNSKSNLSSELVHLSLFLNGCSLFHRKLHWLGVLPTTSLAIYFHYLPLYFYTASLNY